MKQRVRAYAPFEISELGWAVAEGETDEYRFQVRFKCFPSDFPKSNYPVRVNLFWEMEHPLEDGLASLRDVTTMQKFEERLVRISELNGASILTAVLTGRGEREFIFQTQDADNFMKCLHEIPQESARYPIEIFCSDDPDWDYFQNVIGGM